MINFIAQALTSLILLLNTRAIHDWGWSIIALTVIVRGAIWPLTRAQVESMKKMQALQPEIKLLEEKYKDDPEKKSLEMMNIYRVNNVSPFSGCLPLFIQMPILIGMFVALRDPSFTKQLPGFDTASFFNMRLIVKPMETNPFPEIEKLPGMIDLSHLFNTPALYDKFFYLPSLWLFILYLATSIYYSRQMQAQSAATQDPNQKMMSNMMMFMLLYFGLIFPTGLLLYFVMSNVFQMIQQQLTPKPVRVTAPDMPGGEIIVDAEEAAKEDQEKKQRKRKAKPVIDVEPETNGVLGEAKEKKKE